MPEASWCFWVDVGGIDGVFLSLGGSACKAVSSEVWSIGIGDEYFVVEVMLGSLMSIGAGGEDFVAGVVVVPSISIGDGGGDFVVVGVGR